MISQQKITEAARTVRSAGVILYPTETVYGLGGDPARPGVVDRIRQIKRRPAGKPMLLLTDRWERVRPWITNVSPAHERIMAASPPLPVTILFDTERDELSAVRGDAPSIGIRCTNDPFCRALIRTVEYPLISTSANRAGQPAPRRFEDIDSGLLAEVDVAVDAGRPLGGQPSTVVAFDDGELRVVRGGPVSEAELLDLLSDTA